VPKLVLIWSQCGVRAGEQEMLGRIVGWLRCRLRLCSRTVSYDDEGIYWECGRCGKVSR